jgi:hypothetical protein
VADGQSVGTVALLFLPESGELLTSYPVALDSATPSPPVARVGVQVSGELGVRGYQGVHGTIELSALDGTADGRLAVTLRDVDAQDSLRYVAVFHGVSVARPGAAECAALGALLTPADTGATAANRGGRE